MTKKLGLPAGSRVLDVGCGTGAVLARLSAYCEAYGIDASRQAVEYCRRRGLTNTFECTLDTFPHPEMRFDMITLLDVIEHVDDDRAFLRQAKSLLTKSGRILITVPAYKFLWSSHDVINHHKRRYVRSLLRERMEDAGFEVSYLSYFNTLLFPFALVERMLSRFSHQGMDKTLVVPYSPANSLLKNIFSFERNLLARLSLPFGLSLIAAGSPREFSKPRGDFFIK